MTRILLQVDLTNDRQEIVEADAVDWTERGDAVLCRHDESGRRTVRVFYAEEKPVIRYYSREE